MENNEVHIGSGKSFYWRDKLTSRKTIVVVAVILVFAVIGGIYYSVRQSREQKQATFADATKDADTAFYTGNFDQSLESLKEALANAQTDKEKVTIYTKMSAAAVASGNVAEAIGYMEQYHKLDPSTVEPDYYTMGKYYERLGDKTNAIKYYKLTLEYGKSQKPSNHEGTRTRTAGDDVDPLASLALKIQELEAQ